MKTSHFMKPWILAVLCVVSVGGCIPARADDTPYQAAARAALEQKLRELNQPGTTLSPDTNSVTVTAKPAESVTNTTGTVTSNAVALRAAPASTAPADGDFTAKVSTNDASAQAAALAALTQKMYELNHEKARSPSDTNSVITVGTNLAPANEASAAATPVTETPSAEVPMAKSPPMAHPVGASLSAAPAVAAPAPKVSTAPAVAASVAVAPPAVPGSVAMPTVTPVAVAPTTPRLPASSPGRARPTNELVTLRGTIYKNVEVERVTTDAIVISYTPVNGGWAMTKVYFRDLPADIRQEYEKQ